jgi:valine dehydrogenase (NAD+)
VPSATIQQLYVPGFEDVRMCEDPSAGLRAIIAVHDTTLGPALGGTRFYPYADDASALRDVKRLSAGMTYKAACAGLALGGGKAVILGDPATSKSSELLRAYGRFVDTFDGQYITAADVGTAAEDLDVIGETTAHVVGRTAAAGGFGDSGYSTALGVFVSMQTALRVTQSCPLTGLRTGVEGFGKVGSHLVALLHKEGAVVSVCDRSARALARIQAEYPEIRVTDNLLDADIDVYAPCALGATLTPDSIAGLRATVICGAANNQLSADDLDTVLLGRGIHWIPDYVANAGGLIQVAAERDGRSLTQARQEIEQLGGAVENILTRAADERISPAEAAKRIVEDRIHCAR